MNDEVVVERGVSRFGLHRLHVIRWGKAVSDEWLIYLTTELDPTPDPPQIPAEYSGLFGEGVMIEAVVRYEEEGIGLHHLRVYWRENSQDE
jgi:hypothetical protein